MSDHPLDSDAAWLTMRRLVDAGEHKIAVLESMVKGRDAIIESLRARLAEAKQEDERLTAEVFRLGIELGEAERLIRLAYGAVGTLRRMTQEPKSRTSYEDWQREADAFLARERPGP